MIDVVKAGFFSTIQDLGRLGYSSFGVPVSGVMDHYSAQFANALVGNTSEDAVMEMTLVGPELLFKKPAVICISGADMSPKLNTDAISNNHAVMVSEGDVLSFGSVSNGCRTYLAISGGFQTAYVMKSRSMYPNITSKSNIETGDVLKIIPVTKHFNKAHAIVKFNANIFLEHKLQTFKGPEYDLLPQAIQQEIETRSFKISNLYNRMGYQIETSISHNLPTILTAPVLPGTVQLTPSGRLIVLMRDGQTTGGYPRVLQLKEEAINVLAQKKVGDSIQFILI